MRVRLTGIAAAVFAVMAAVLMLSSPAHAAAAPKCPTIPIPPADDVIQIVGQLNDTRTDPCSPVPGVKITVENEAGDVLVEGESQADGTFVLPLPGATIDNLGTTVVVKIDKDTLPEGTELTNPDDVSNSKKIQIEGNIVFAASRSDPRPIRRRPSGKKRST